MPAAYSYAVLFLILYSQVENVVEGCHNVQEVKQNSEFGISGRKKRDAFDNFKTSAKDADSELSEFFTPCLLSKTGPIFNSWRSVVDFILRDTLWFEATDTSYCSDRKDTVKCWQRRLALLLKPGSSLFRPAVDCINEFGKSVKEKMDLKFKLFYQTFYESYEDEPTYGEFRRWKRDLYGSVFGRAQNILNDLDWQLDIKFTTHRTYFVTESAPTTSTPSISTSIIPTPPLIQERECPSYSSLQYASCITKSVKGFVDTPVMIEFPSLAFFDEESNAKFVKEHYSSCRITKEKSGDKAIYLENCHTTENHAVSKGDTSLYDFSEDHVLNPVASYIAPISPCLVYDMPEIVKPSSPLFSPVESCTADVLDNTKTTTNPTLEASVPIFDTISTTSVIYERPSQKGRIGKCDNGDHWTMWFNTDSPEGKGDMEILHDLRARFRGQICESPMAVDARTAQGNKYHSNTEDLIYLSLQDGLRCFNNEQIHRTCSDFKIRFCCRVEIPRCEGSKRWTRWFDRDSPNNGGDDESLSKHISENGVCEHPTAIQARIKRSRQHYRKGFNIIDISPETGLVCNESDQLKRSCTNYEVSFCCPQ